MVAPFRQSENEPETVTRPEIAEVVENHIRTLRRLVEDIDKLAFEDAVSADFGKGGFRAVAQRRAYLDLSGDRLRSVLTAALTGQPEGGFVSSEALGRAMAARHAQNEAARRPRTPDALVAEPVPADAAA